MALHDAKVVVAGFFNLVHTRNTGIAFSLFADSDPVVKTISFRCFPRRRSRWWDTSSGAAGR